MHRLAARNDCSSAEARTLLWSLNERSTALSEVSLEALDQDLGSVFRLAGVVPAKSCFLWQKIDEIDLFDTEHLIQFFSDLWYPSADDVEIFDDSLDWMLFVRHDGAVVVLHPNRSSGTSQPV